MLNRLFPLLAKDSSRSRCLSDSMDVARDADLGRDAVKRPFSAETALVDEPGGFPEDFNEFTDRDEREEFSKAGVGPDFGTDITMP